MSSNISEDYYRIDRYLRNNLSDDDYAEYSASLDVVLAFQPPQDERGHELIKAARAAIEAWDKTPEWFSVPVEWTGPMNKAMVILNLALSAASAPAQQSTPPQPVAAEVADTARINALEACTFPNRWTVAHNQDSFTVYFGPGRHATRRTVREAIDATLSGTGSDESKKG